MEYECPSLSYPTHTTTIMHMVFFPTLLLSLSPEPFLWKAAVGQLLGTGGGNGISWTHKDVPVGTKRHVSHDSNKLSASQQVYSDL